MQPASIRDQYHPNQIRAWFKKADLNGDGTLSIDEVVPPGDEHRSRTAFPALLQSLTCYRARLDAESLTCYRDRSTRARARAAAGLQFFKWSLSNASAQHGSNALAIAFQRYDREGTGELDAMEFSNACSDLGFGSAAHDIFRTLDATGKGTVSYKELVDNVTANAPSNLETKNMLTAMVVSLNSTKAVEARKRIDTSEWRLRGEDTQAVQNELRRLLQASGGHVADLVNIFADESIEGTTGSPGDISSKCAHATGLERCLMTAALDSPFGAACGRAERHLPLPPPSRPPPCHLALALAISPSPLPSRPPPCHLILTLPSRLAPQSTISNSASA